MERHTTQRREELLRRIDAARTRQKLFRVAAGVWLFTGLMALVLAADLVVYSDFALPADKRLLILRVTGYVAGLLFLVCVVLPSALPRRSRLRTAQRVERHFGGLKNGLVTTVELATPSEPSRMSSELLDLATDWTWQACSSLKLARSVSARAMNCCAIASAACLAVFATTVAKDPAAAFAAWHSFAADYTTILVEPGDARVQYGESLKVTVETTGRLTLENWLLYREEPYGRGRSGEWQEVKLVERPAGSRRFTHTFGPVHQPIAYRIQADDTHTRAFTVALGNPKLLSTAYTVRFPEAFGLEPERGEGGEIETFPGTTALLRATASEPMASAQIVMEDGSASEMEVDGQSLFGQFVVGEPTSYSIKVIDLEGERNLEPEGHEVRTITTPVVRLIGPGSGEMQPHSLLPLKVWTGDDQGVITAELRYRLRSEAGSSGDRPEHLETLDQTAPPRPIQLLNLTWHLRNRRLKVGEVVTYRVEVKDEHGNVTCSPWNTIEVTEQFASERYEQATRAKLMDLVRDQQRERWPRKYHKMIGAYFDRLARFSLGKKGRE